MRSLVLLTILTLTGCLATPGAVQDPEAPAGAFNGARFVRQQIPACFQPGESVQVEVTLTNTGTTTWTPDRVYRLGIIPETNIWTGDTRIPLQPGERVRPGDTKTFRFVMTAPLREGSHAVRWRMVQEQVQWFGGISPETQIRVGACQ